MFFFFFDDHEELPTIRIQKVVLDNFKSVKHGEIVFDCGRKFVPYDTKSDILGIYGQNGSGKTSLIEALSILKNAMKGSKIPESYADCISKWSDSARLSFTFDLQYPDGKIRKAVYEFSIASSDISEDEATYEEQKLRIPYKCRVTVFDEILSMSGDFSDGKKTLKPILDTSSTTEVFEPKSKQKFFVSSDETLEDLKYQKRLAREKSLSFIFSKDTVKEFYDNGINSEYYQVVVQLRHFASENLFVVDTKSFGYIRSGFYLPIFTRERTFLFNTMEPQILPDETANSAKLHIDNINTVLEQLIPLLSIQLKVISEAVTKDGESGKLVELVARRDGIDMPVRDESDGVKKIVSILSLIISVFNDCSVTVAIDEIDAGIYEYLLGELLQMVQDSGKGQLVFTSHNLRPLEVLKKEFICFTTTDPSNRYYRLKGVGATNNLRNTYIREILMNDQDVELYKRTKKYKIMDALVKTGCMGLMAMGVAIAGATNIMSDDKEKE